MFNSAFSLSNAMVKTKTLTELKAEAATGRALRHRDEARTLSLQQRRLEPKEILRRADENIELAKVQVGQKRLDEHQLYTRAHSIQRILTAFDGQAVLSPGAQAGCFPVIAVDPLA
ncbi:hypothetical protein AXG93_793s1130 [Marchantia polymorpha subsp. ruderalis]|uniref:Uncharacterized protein n=1 Tax=Marchantia polymorpha subsp. ruderalis TaxID=1480154 RepID=A0A176W221_MARPO|nr:hypothetical protein AXG93_793s1130 [Marchantia polymorpha subsp. ruderalis]